MSLAVLLVGGEVTATSALRERVQRADLVVAADGGLRHARPLGLEPHLLVGDMDSLDDAILALHPSLEVQAHPEDKDELDLELGLAACRERGARRLLVIGGLSGRLDQTLATCLVVQAAHQDGLDCEVDDGRRSLWPLRPGETRRLPLHLGQRFSLLALDEQVIVSLSGARYPLDRSTLRRSSGRGLSNEATAMEVEVHAHEGAVVVIAPADGD